MKLSKEEIQKIIDLDNVTPKIERYSDKNQEQFFESLPAIKELFTSLKENQELEYSPEIAYRLASLHYKLGSANKYLFINPITAVPEYKKALEILKEVEKSEYTKDTKLLEGNLLCSIYKLTKNQNPLQKNLLDFISKIKITEENTRILTEYNENNTRILMEANDIADKVDDILFRTEVKILLVWYYFQKYSIVKSSYKKEIEELEGLQSEGRLDSIDGCRLTGIKEKINTFKNGCDHALSEFIDTIEMVYDISLNNTLYSELNFFESRGFTFEIKTCDSKFENLLNTTLPLKVSSEEEIIFLNKFHNITIDEFITNEMNEIKVSILERSMGTVKGDVIEEIISYGCRVDYDSVATNIGVVGANPKDGDSE